MRYLPNTNKKLIVILLLMQLCMAYAHPAWASLNLCIGFDGHVDFERFGLVGSSTQPVSQLAVVSSNDDHHGDCFDIEMGGFSSDYLYVRAEELRFRDGENSSQIVGEGALSSYTGLSHLSPNPTYNPHNIAISSSALAFHRTVVLLI